MAPEVMFEQQLGRTWELVSIGAQIIPSSPVSAGVRRPGQHPGMGARPTLRFTANAAGTLSTKPDRRSAGGWSFCNGYGTAYEVGPRDQLRFYEFQSTLVGCNGPDSLETRFFRALHETRRFELDASHLSLIAADGTRLTFVVSPDSL